MIVVPAVDIRGGKVVRLKHGELQQVELEDGDPVAVARRWQDEGAARIHLVDLDASISGQPQFDVVAEVIRAVTVPVAVGGGLRVLENAMRYRQRGAQRLVFGTAAVAAPGVVQEALRRWPDSVAVAIDARDGKVAVAGWNEINRVEAVELASQLGDWRVQRVQYSDVVRDGGAPVPNLRGLEALARSHRFRITAAGGVSSLDDLRRLRPLEELGVDEAVVGKALYDGRFTLAEALAAAR